MNKPLIIIGAGPAGLSAAIESAKSGLDCEDIVVLERDTRPGGILPQCIHNGFGLHKFGEELTGPEYALRLAGEAEELGIKIKLGATVLSIDQNRRVKYASEKEGVRELEGGAIVLAMGCRERPRGALGISGTRPAGVYTAGCAQKLVNVMGMMPGKKVVILGSGDIGLIMARRMTLEGAKVEAVCELMSYSGGLARNIQQCLIDFGIPLYLSTTVVKIHGEDRLCGVTVAQVDEKRRVIEGTERFIECDTLLLSCGLIPENELTRAAGIPIDKVTGGAIVDDRRETLAPGIFACGNVLHVHDLADFASDEGAIAGANAAKFILENQGNTDKTIEYSRICARGAVRYTVPQRVVRGSETQVYFRVGAPVRSCTMTVRSGDDVVMTKPIRAITPGEMQKIAICAEWTKKDIEIEITEAAK